MIKDRYKVRVVRNKEGGPEGGMAATAHSVRLTDAGDLYIEGELGESKVAVTDQDTVTISILTAEERADLAT